MGLLGFITGTDKIALIRSLLIARVECDPAAQKSGFSSVQVRQLTDLQLMGAPEATMTTIMESFVRLMSAGDSYEKAIAKIESHRANLGIVAPSSLTTIEEFLEDRVRIEHQDTFMPAGHVKLCRYAAEELFTMSRNAGAADAAMQKAKNNILSDRQSVLLNALSDHFMRGDIDEEELLGRIGDELETWEEARIRSEKGRAAGNFLRFLHEANKGS